MKSMSNLNLARKSTLTDDIVEKLMLYIANNKLEAGALLPSEKKLTAVFGVSRLPLREALSRLKALGVISVRQGKGAFVGRIDVSSLFRHLSPIMRSQGNLNVDHMMEVRIALEPAVARLSAERRDAAVISFLKDCLLNMKNNLASKEEFLRYDMEYHRALGRATNNPALDILVSSIDDISLITHRVHRDDIEARRVSLRYHEKIYQAVAAGDGERAAKEMEAHLRNTAVNLNK